MNSWTFRSTARPQAAYPALDLKQDTFQLHEAAGAVRAQRPNPYAQGTALHRAFELQSANLSKSALSCCSERGYEACHTLFCAIPQCLSSFVNLTLDDPANLIRAVLDGRKIQEQIQKKHFPKDGGAGQKSEPEVCAVQAIGDPVCDDLVPAPQGPGIILHLLSNYADHEEPFVMAFPRDLRSDLVCRTPQDVLIALARGHESISSVLPQMKLAAYVLALSAFCDDDCCTRGNPKIGPDAVFYDAVPKEDLFEIAAYECKPILKSALYESKFVSPAWSFEQHAFLRAQASKTKQSRAKREKSKAAPSSAPQKDGALSFEDLKALAAQNCSDPKAWGMADHDAQDKSNDKKSKPLAPPSSFKLDRLCQGGRGGAALKSAKGKTQKAPAAGVCANLSESTASYEENNAPLYNLEVPVLEPQGLFNHARKAGPFKNADMGHESVSDPAFELEKDQEPSFDIMISSVLSDRALEALLKGETSSLGQNFKLEQEDGPHAKELAAESFYAKAGLSINFELLQSLFETVFDDVRAILQEPCKNGLSDGNFARLDPYRPALEAQKDTGTTFELELGLSAQLPFDEPLFWDSKTASFANLSDDPAVKAGQKGRAQTLAGARALKKAQNEISKEERLYACFERAKAQEQEALLSKTGFQKTKQDEERSFDEELYAQASALPASLLLTLSPLQLLSISSGQSRGAILSLADSFCTHPLKVLRAVCGAHENNALPKLLKHSLLIAGAKNEERLHFLAPKDITAMEMARLNAPSSLIARLCKLHHSTSANLVQKCQSEGLCSNETAQDDALAKSALHYLFLTLMVYFYNLSVTLLKLKEPGFFAELDRFEKMQRPQDSKSAGLKLAHSGAEELKHSPQVLLPALMVGAYKSASLLHASRLFDDVRHENVFPSFAAFAGVLELLYKGRGRIEVCLECGCHYPAPNPGSKESSGFCMCKACALKKHHRFQDWAYKGGGR